MGWPKAPTSLRWKVGQGATLSLAAVAIAATIAAAIAASPWAEAQKGSVLRGFVEPEDGDTFFIGQVEIRLHGYDTPEDGKRCGAVNVYESANAAMRSLVEGKQVACIDTGKRNGGRVVADCSVDSRDIGEQLVALGWGRDWPKFSDGRYCNAEREARAAKRGLWGLSCPSDLWSDNRGPRNYVNSKTKKVCQ